MSDQQTSVTYTYGYFREEKPREQGFSHELISADYEYIKDQSTLDCMDAIAYPGIDTLYKGMQR